MRKVLDSEEYDELKQTDQDQIPEYKLLKAVLTRALQDYTGILKGRPSSKDPQISERDDVVKDRRRHAIAAEEWLFDDTEAPRGKFTHFTFRWICLHLDLDPQVIRREATRIKRFAEEYGKLFPMQVCKKRFWPTVITEYTEGTILQGVVQCEPRSWLH